ncbi:hypothetical protein V8E55_002576, partial [Tylopilus felleus]
TRSKVKIYSDKFYDMKIKPLVDAEIAAQMCQMLLENEDKDVKQIIDEIYAAEQQQRHISQLSDNEDEEPQMNADIVAAK